MGSWAWLNIGFLCLSAFFFFLFWVMVEWVGMGCRKGSGMLWLLCGWVMCEIMGGYIEWDVSG